MMKISTAASATKGLVSGEDVMFSSIGIDSRAIVKDQLFIAIKGENFDGHDYVDSALEQGAAAVMVAKQMSSTPAVTVKDTHLALGELSAYWRTQFDIPLVAITGSNGKTTVKEMLTSILAQAAGDSDAVLATRGNFNNDIGMPLTLFRLNAQHQYSVIEMGMNHAGEIRYLTNLAKPNIALVNNANSAHIGELGSLEAIAKAKSEIFEGLAEDGTAIINADDVFAPLWKQVIGRKKILSFGLNKEADVSADYQLKEDASHLNITTPKGNMSFELPVAGKHNVMNALAAASAAIALDVSIENISLGLSQFAGVKGRLQLKAGVNDAVVIDDTYNANPDSMKAAIDVLAARNHSKVMVMGDMGELGEIAAQKHAEIGAYAKQAGIESFYALGDDSLNAVKAFGDGAQHFMSAEALSQSLIAQMRSNTSVLVKGSRFMGMERVVNLITIDKKGDAHVA